MAAALPSAASAQTITSAVPGLIAYQGKVTTAAGALVGASTPVNRIVIFRIWDHASNSTVSNLVYSEQQTVTISEGEFSVLVGQGTAVAGTPLGYSESSKGPPSVTFNNSFAVFGGSARFLGVTVDDGTGAVDPEVSPRQQIVTSAYAFRARYAEGLGSNGGFSLAVTDQGNVGVGLANPTFPLTTAATFGTKLGLFGNFNYGLGIQLNQLQVFGATNADDVVFGYGSSAALTETMRVKGNGNIGIGTNSPQSKLDVNGRITLLDGGARNQFGGLVTEASAIMINFGMNDSRFGTQNNSEQGGFLRVNTQSGSNLFQFYGRPAAGTGISELMALTSAGNLGLGVAPTEKLHVSGNALVTGNVGIGTTTPATKLDVNGAGQFSGGTQIGNVSAGFFGDGTSLAIRAFNSASSDLYFQTHAGAATHMIVKNGGNVGIGTTTPEAKLRVVAPAATTDTAMFTRTGSANTSHIHFGTDGDVYWRSASSSGKVILQDSGGYVGIGTSAPQYPLDVRGSIARTFQLEAVLGNGGASDIANETRSDLAHSAYFEGRVRSASFDVNSDARIKSVVGRSSGASDLSILQQLEVTDYTFRDTVTYGGRPQRKLIAQQVERVFPQAVSRSTGTVPDIYASATTTDGWVNMATDLRRGERVRLIANGRDVLEEVLEVEPNRFRTAFKSETGKVVVYGREVKDFRSVDYEAIAMLNVSATQEIKREKDAEVAALRTENATLRERLAALEAKERTRDSKLAAIEKLLQASQTVMARPVSRPTPGEQE